jgi:hypothetical protein
MTWIKQNYDQFILGILALLLCALSGYLILNALNFQQVFAGIKSEPFHNNKVPPLDMTEIQATNAALKTPATWDLTDTEGSLFISVPYIVGPDGTTLIDPRNSPTPLRPPVPNKWLINNKLDILDNNILNEDPDGTGFTVLDDWKNVKGDGSDSVDPQDKTQHPPYWTKLRLHQYIKEPFEILFESYDGDLKKPSDIQFQINTLNYNQPTQFLKIGDTIAGPKPFKLMKFEYKSVTDAATDSTKDVSELTIQNTQNGDVVVMVLEQKANSPDSYADFIYLWNNTEFKVKKGQQFALPPESTPQNTIRYKLIDISDTEALIQTPAGPQVKVPLQQ